MRQGVVRTLITMPRVCQARDIPTIERGDVLMGMSSGESRRCQRGVRDFSNSKDSGEVTIVNGRGYRLVPDPLASISLRTGPDVSGQSTGAKGLKRGSLLRPSADEMVDGCFW